MKILHRINRAIARFSRSPQAVIGEGAAGARADLGQIEAAERQEFPAEEFPAEEFPAEEHEESE